MTDVTEAEYRVNVQEMFKALDMDRNNELDWDECRDLVGAVMKQDGGYNSESFKSKYDKMDKNDDGKISKKELIEACVEVGRERNLFKTDKAMVKQAPNIGGRATVEIGVLDDPNEAEVDKKIFREGLSCLGKTFNNARHAYLKMNINEKALSTLKGIGSYKYLQYIDVSNNSLTSLTQLSNIKHLIKLNASNNRITKMFDFAPFANLEVVDYSHN